ncbi:efflux RND transporter periplasmic adaptor subunit [Moraxella oblonga]|uniref:efflux RND transporter periplasmic adaptor subunit n=1 Tax=Moraxella oblonga TaxID=200413 RepID=UPI0014704ADD|nr:efflux RND transporter periplasmic adaptor subunit [Moraxella oblonga]
MGFLLGKNTGKSQIASQTSQATQNTNNTKPITMTIQATTPKVMTIDENIMANGIIHAKDVAEVSAKFTGATIEQVLVEVGDTVKAGQVLATLDNQTAKENVAQAIADYEQAVASHEQAVADLARVEPLLKLDAISHQQVDTYRTAVKQTQATQKASLARLNTAKNNLNNTQIISPISGVISTKNAQVGMAVGGTSLFSIIKGGKLEWQATLSPADAQKIHVGQTAEVMVNDEIIQGKVTHLSPTANSGREIIVHVATPPHPMLKAGMYQRGKFVFGNTTHHAIPSSAIINTDGYDYVWTLNPYQNQDKPSDKPIYQTTRTRVHLIAHNQDQVATDLPLDTLIVANGVSFLNEGDLVHIVMADTVGAK